MSAVTECHLSNLFNSFPKEMIKKKRVWLEFYFPRANTGSNLNK